MIFVPLICICNSILYTGKQPPGSITSLPFQMPLTFCAPAQKNENKRIVVSSNRCISNENRAKRPKHFKKLQKRSIPFLNREKLFGFFVLESYQRILLFGRSNADVKALLTSIYDHKSRVRRNATQVLGYHHQFVHLIIFYF